MVGQYGLEGFRGPAILVRQSGGLDNWQGGEISAVIGQSLRCRHKQPSDYPE